MPEVMTDQWATQVMEEHRELRHRVDDLRAYLDRPRPEVGELGAHRWATGLSRMLLDLHDQLVRHFRFEEQGGMVEDLQTRFPRASSELEEILDDHPAMLSSLRELVTCTLIYSEGRTPSDAQLRRRVGQLLEHLSRHERNETALIQRLEYRDIPAGD